MPLLDLAEHLLNVGGRKRITRGFANRLQLGFGVVQWLARPSLPEHPANPFTDGDSFTAGEPLDFGHLPIGQLHLKALTHKVSILRS